MRYRLWLHEGEFVAKENTRKPWSSSDKIDGLRFNGVSGYSTWHILDTKTGKKISMEEYWEILKVIRSKKS